MSGELAYKLGIAINIKLNESIEPIRLKPYSISHADIKMVKSEVDRMTNIGKIRKIDDSTWCFSSLA